MTKKFEVIGSLNPDEVFDKADLSKVRGGKDNDTGKICPRCGSEILSFKRGGQLADKWVCLNKECTGVW